MDFLPEEVDRSEEWIYQAVAGVDLTLKYADDDTISIGSEYFHNDLGYEDINLYTWLLWQGAYQPFWVGRDYLSVFVYLPQPGQLKNHTWTASWIRNLSDGSHVGRTDWSGTLLTWLTLNAWVQVPLGTEKGELNFAVEIPELPVDGFEEGLSVPPTLLSAGLGDSVRF